MSTVLIVVAAFITAAAAGMAFSRPEPAPGEAPGGQFQLHVRCEGVAFAFDENSAPRELARLLRVVADEVIEADSMHALGYTAAVVDITGQPVGAYRWVAP